MKMKTRNSIDLENIYDNFKTRTSFKKPLMFFKKALRNFLDTICIYVCSHFLSKASWIFKKINFLKAERYDANTHRTWVM